jgi:hypothetical protein
VAKLSPHDAWQQPILRLADTAIGVAVGLAAAWLGLRAVRPLIRPPGSPVMSAARLAGGLGLPPSPTNNRAKR